jgi:integrase
MQKNQTEEAIPLLPEFESLLLEVPMSERSGWVFNPFGGRRGIAINGKRRMKLDRVSRIISKIGRYAGIVVAESRNGGEPKYASAHDLRRSCADRLIAAGVPERDVARIMRHASIETTRRYYAPIDVQRAARSIRDCLSGPVKKAIDRLDRRWLTQAIKDVENDKQIVGSSSWVVRVDAVKRRFKEIVGDDSAFPWSDSVIIDLWGTL